MIYMDTDIRIVSTNHTAGSQSYSETTTAFSLGRFSARRRMCVATRRKTRFVSRHV